MTTFMNSLNQISRLFIAPFLIIVILLTGESFAGAAATPSVQEYYVPIAESQLLDGMLSIYPSAATCGGGAPNVIDPMVTTVAIAATADGTVIYYDHWEDGFEVDLSSPTQSTTEIWGDNNKENGVVPGQAVDRIFTNKIVELSNEVTSSTPSVIDFDGGDRFGTTKAVAVTRAGWSVGPGTSFAGATEVKSVSSWGQQYDLPVGPLSDRVETFEHVSLFIMAAQDGTVVQIDRNADGTTDIETILNQGESLHEDGGLVTGATVTASAPVQVQMLGGDICEEYESRWYTLHAVETLGSSYHVPVSTNASYATNVFVYNPTDSTIIVRWDTAAGAQPSIILNSGTSTVVQMPSNSAAHFYTSGDPFYALTAVDTGAFFDWGFSLLPEQALTQKALVAWGPGVDPNVVSSENGNPAWVTVVSNPPPTSAVKVCADFDNDGTSDDFYMIDYLQSQPIFDSDLDQSGMLIYVCDASGANVSVAWGPDPDTASPGLPGLDVGTLALPLPAIEIGISAEVTKDADLDNAASGGDELRYKVVVRNGGALGLQNLLLTGGLSAEANYLSGSTTIDAGSGPISIPDSGTTPFPFDEDGTNLGSLVPSGSFEIEFDVAVSNMIPAEVQSISGSVVVQAGGDQAAASVTTPLNFEPAVTLQKTVYVGHDGGASCAGSESVNAQADDPLTYCFVVINTGDTYLNQPSLTDIPLSIGINDVTLASGSWPLMPGGSSTYYYETGMVGSLVNTADLSVRASDDTGVIRPQLSIYTARDTAEVVLVIPTATPTNTPTNTPAPPTVTNTPTNTPIPPTITSTSIPPTITNTPTNTPVPPTATNTSVPPTATNTSVPPTATNTSIPPTATNTPVPPTATNTPAPPTATATATPSGINCVYGQGFWKNHSQLWPVQMLTLGGVTYGRDQLVDFLQTPPRGDATYILIHQLIAAELNVAQGADSSDAGSRIADANSWMIVNPIGSDPSGPVREEAIALATWFDLFNNGQAGVQSCDGNIIYIGSTVWLDGDQDGEQDEAESGIPGVTVNLYNSTQEKINSTVTDENGQYFFEALGSIADYQVRLDHPDDHHIDGALGNLLLTDQDATFDDIDSDGFYDVGGYPTIELNNVGTELNDFGFVAGSCTTEVYGRLRGGFENFGDVTNNSTDQSYLVGLAIYQKVDEIIDNQILFDFQTIVLEPGQSTEMVVADPGTAVQVDLFCGPVLYSLDDLRYGPRLLHARHLSGPYQSDAVCPVDYTLQGIFENQAVTGVAHANLQVDRPLDGWVTFTLIGPNGLNERRIESVEPYYFKGDMLVNGVAVPVGWDTSLYPDGRYRLQAQINDLDCAAETVHFAIQNDVQAGNLQGTVHTNGLGVSGLPVFLRPVDRGVEQVVADVSRMTSGHYETITDSDGHYRFADVPYGLYQLEVGAADFGSQFLSDPQLVHITANAANTLVFDIVNEALPSSVFLRDFVTAPSPDTRLSLVTMLILSILSIAALDYHIGRKRK